MDEESKLKYRLLYFLINDMAKKEKLTNKRLEETLNDQKLMISNPSLILFKKAFQNMIKLTDIDKKEIIIQLDKELISRINIIKNLDNNLDNLEQKVDEFKNLVNEIQKLDNQLKELSKEYIEESIDYIDNYARDFKRKLDLYQFNNDANLLQKMLMKKRFEKAESIHKEYDCKEKIDQLKLERLQLKNELDQLNLKEKQLIERKKLIETFNENLVNEFKNLKNNYKMTEWVMNTLDK